MMPDLPEIVVHELFAFVMPGVQEIVILGVVAFIVLVVCGNRLPTAMRNLGRGIVEFKKGARGVTEDMESAVQEGEENSSKVDES